MRGKCMQKDCICNDSLCSWGRESELKGNKMIFCAYFSKERFDLANLLLVFKKMC